MANGEKLQRTINSVNEHLISLRNTEAPRKLNLGSDWTKIRIGLRCGFAPKTSHGNIGSDNTLFIGLLSDASKPRGGSDTIPHYVGWRNSGGWTYDSGNDVYNLPSTFGAEDIFEKIENGSATTASTSDGSDGRIKMAAIPAKLYILFFEVTKGSPWTLTLRRHESGTINSESNSDLKDDIIATSGLSSYEMQSQTLSVDEATYGDLVVPTVYWENQTSHWLEIADFYVAKLD